MLAVGLIGLTSCGEGEKKAPEPTPAPTETPTETPTAVSDTARVTISGDDKMQFDLKEITVNEGQVVELTLKHVGTMAAAAMGHNFVLLSNDISLEDFATEAIQAKATDYIPAGEKAVIAHTKVIGGGETDVITFTAPAKGSYDFLCSFPGHYGTMHGTFIVK